MTTNGTPGGGTCTDPPLPIYLGLVFMVTMIIRVRIGVCARKTPPNVLKSTPNSRKVV